MLEKIVMLQWSNFGAQDWLNQLEGMGFFSYVLPFLLIFALVYAIATKLDIFEKNKGAAVLVAFAIGLLSLQLNWVSAFFQDVFPKFGVGLSLLLIALILAGAFINTTTNKKAYSWIFFGLGALIFIIIGISSLSSIQFIGSNWFQQYGALVIMVVIIAGAIVGVIVASKGDETKS